MSAKAVAVFQGPAVEGYVEFFQHKHGTVVSTNITKLPAGKHGFHIHKAGDLRGEGCKAACDHWHKGRPTKHGGPPSSEGSRHTGDLGNIEMDIISNYVKVEHLLRNVKVDELYGRSLIVHADPDDLGKGNYEDSHTTGHSGARIACAIIGRVSPSCAAKINAKSNSKYDSFLQKMIAGDPTGFDPSEDNFAPFGTLDTRKIRR